MNVCLGASVSELRISESPIGVLVAPSKNSESDIDSNSLGGMVRLAKRKNRASPTAHKQ